MREPDSTPQGERHEGNELTTADLAQIHESTVASHPENDVEKQVTGDRERWAQAGAQDQTKEPTPLFAETESVTFRTRWTTVQADFVDDPRHAVEAADHLVAEAIQRLSQVFATEREGLEKQWSGGGDPSTEDLRVALQRYRSFFEQLLAA
jgi:hypothetical protein